jgi:hypothetical protein
METQLVADSLEGQTRPCHRPEANARKNKSKVSNGKNLLPGVDMRSEIGRRYRDIVQAILIDQGGADQCSESRKHLIRRFSAAAVLAEQLEARLVGGEQIDIQEHATLSSTLVRLAQRIGVERIPRDVMLPLRDRWEVAQAPSIVEATTIAAEAAEPARNQYQSNTTASTSEIPKSDTDGGSE